MNLWEGLLSELILQSANKNKAQVVFLLNLLKVISAYIYIYILAFVM